MIAAFFDIDGTLYRNSLLVENFKKLIKYEILDKEVFDHKIKKPLEDWNQRKGDYEEYLVDVSSTFIEQLTGIDLPVIEFMAKQVVNQHWEKAYVYTRERIQWHKDQGHKIIFISGSPDFLVSKMAKLYGADYYRASTYVMEEGVFSGTVHPMWDSVNKRNAIHAFERQLDLNLEECYAYGDTTGDFTMLEMVGHPVALNPNRSLLDLIRESDGIKERVSIVVERKDVIYHIDPKSIEERFK